MSIKSLLIGSAAAAVMATGAQAADAIVVADPEPMDYVRICDVYGAGFFYIPGTETCLKIGGYVRYDIYHSVDAADAGTKKARFAPNFDVRTDTSIGTVRGYAEIEFDWDWGTRAGIAAGAPAALTGYGLDINPLHVYVQVVRPNGGSWLFGKTESPYTRFLGYAGPTINDGYYGYNTTSEISYTFEGSNGFQFVAALLEDDNDWTPDAELGVNFSRGWGSIGAIVGYDSSLSSFGAKASLVVNFPNTAGSYFKLMAMYTDNVGSIYGTDGASNFSVLAGLNLAFNQKVSLALTAQWMDSGAYLAALAVPVTFAEGLVVTPEIGYDTAGGNVAGPFYGIVRINRSF